MSATLSPPVVAPISTTALLAVSKTARAAAFLLTFGAARQTIVCDLSQLPPGQKFGPLGTVYVDNTQNANAAVLSFPDTQAIFDIPANSAPFMLAITGGKRFTLTTPSTVNTNMGVQCLDFVTAPTGIQPVFGNVTIAGGSITLTNPGPANGLPVSRSLNVAAAANTVMAAANGNRKFIMFQFPLGSDGWINMNGGVASVAGVDCLYCQAGEKFLSTSYVPAGQISVFLTNGGQMPFLEG